MTKKKLCIITGSRAEWGIFYPLAKEIKRNKDLFILQIIATGSHLSPKFGLTYKEIEKDGFGIDRAVKILLPGDTEEAIAKSVGRAIIGITDSIKSLKPDLIFLLGDRFETFAAAVASLFLKVPVAHIHGGELTEGSIDDSLRHAITKMTYLHFVSTETYRHRVIQMGEDPKRVFNVGALGLDNIKNARLLNREEFQERINFKLGAKNIMVTFHPSTYEKKKVSEKQCRSLLKAIDALPDVKVIFTKPGADMYSQIIIKLIDDYVSMHRDKAIAFESMGRELYLSAIRFMDVVAGNSSSGIIEVPSFGIPTINIGRREDGRIKGDTVIDVPECGVNDIKRAFLRALSDNFRKRCKGAKNLYGDGKASRRIVDIVKKVEIASSRKRFLDLYLKSPHAKIRKGD